MEDKIISGRVVGCAIKVHQALGPGLLESSYHECLFYELKKAGLRVIEEMPLPLVYEAINLDCGYRIDLFVENQLVIEVKSVDALNDIHMAQVLTYLKLSDCKYGLLINFNLLKLVNGIKRLVIKYKEWIFCGPLYILCVPCG